MQKDYIIFGPYFGIENVVKKYLIRRDMHYGKAEGRYFLNHLRSCMRHLVFVSFPEDTDVWTRQKIIVIWRVISSMHCYTPMMC